MEEKDKEQTEKELDLSKEWWLLGMTKRIVEPERWRRY